MGYWENIWLGVLAGVLTSALLFLLGQLWVHTLLPFLKETRYQGVVVAGAWTAELLNDPGEPTTTIKLTLNQSTQNLTGIFHFANRKPGNEFDLTFHVHGRLWEGYVSMTLTPVDRKVTSVATALFKLAGGGGVLTGSIAIRNVNTERVEASDLSLFRPKV